MQTYAKRASHSTDVRSAALVRKAATNALTWVRRQHPRILRQPVDERQHARSRPRLHRQHAAADRRSGRGETRHVDQLPQPLGALEEQAHIESVTASSAIEGVHVADARVPNLADPVAGPLEEMCRGESCDAAVAVDEWAHTTCTGSSSPTDRRLTHGSSRQMADRRLGTSGS